MAHLAKIDQRVLMRGTEQWQRKLIAVIVITMLTARFMSVTEGNRLLSNREFIGDPGILPAKVLRHSETSPRSVSRLYQNLTQRRKMTRCMS